MKIHLSDYYSEDGKNRAAVIKNDDVYEVVMTNKNRTTVKTFFKEELAENYAEDYVSNYKEYNFWGE
jgi:hypothetical protein